MTIKINAKANKKAAVTSYDFIKGLKLENALSVNDYSTKAIQKQFIDGPARAELQAKILDQVKPPKKIVRCVRCFGCRKSFAPSKMSNCLIFCRECFRASQGKGERARTNFVDRALNDLRIFLGGRV